MRRIATLLTLAAVAAAALLAAQASALPTCTKRSLISGDWSAPATWQGGVVPTAADHVCVEDTVTVAGPVTVASVQITARLTVASGTFTVAGGDESLLSGEIGGPGTFALAGAMTWSGGYMRDAGTTRVLAGAVLTQQTNSVNMWETRTLEVAGTLRLATAGRGISRSSSPVISVTGTGLVENTSSGVVTIGPVVHNAGRVGSPIAGGVLELHTGGGTGSSTGRFGAAGQAGTVRFETAPAHRLGDGAQLLGGVEIAGAVEIPDGAEVAASGANRQSSGEIRGGGTLEIGGSYAWSGGYMRDAGVTRVLAGAVLTQETNSVNMWETRTLEVAGTLRLATAGRGIARSSSPVISVASTGLVENASNGVVTIGPVVHNAGRIESPVAGGVLELDTGGGTGSSPGRFGAAGQAGTVRLSTAPAHRFSDGAQLLGGVEIAGAVEIPEGAEVTTSGANRQSSGEVRGGGTLEIGGAYVWSGGYMRDAGLTRVLAGATLTQQTNSVNMWETRRIENAGDIVLATPDRGIARSGTPSIHNLATGEIRKTAGGANAVEPALENDGAVIAEVAGSTLTVRGRADGAVSTGTFGGAGTVRLDSFGANRFTLGSGAGFPGGVAIASGSVTIADGATVTAAGPLALAGGILDGPGTLAVNGGMTWTGGRMEGAGLTTVAAGATLAMPGQGGLQLGGTRELRVAGTLDMAEDNSLFAPFQAVPLLHITSTGTLRKSGGDSWSFVSVPLRNEGTAESSAGELQLSQGAAQPHSGAFESASATARVALTGTGHVLTGAAELGDHTRIAGDVTVRDGDTLAIAGDVLQTGGELSGDVTISGAYAWAGGSHEAPGTTAVTPAGSIRVAPDDGDGCATMSLGEGRTLVNQGVLRLASGHMSGFGDDRPELHNPGRIELDSTGCGGFAGISGDLLVANTGTIDKVGGTGSSYIGSSLDNDGTVVASAPGDLRLESNAATGHAGTFRGEDGAVAFESGTFVLDPGAAVDGAVAVAGAELLLPEGMTLDVSDGETLRLSDGVLGGAGDVRVAGTLAWEGGSQEGPGSTIVESGGTALVAPPEGEDSAFVSLQADRSIVNRGTLTVDASRVNVQDGASIFNRGTLEVNGGSQLSGFGFGDGFASLLHNAGTLRKTGAGTAEVGVPVDNDGTIAVDAGTLAAQELVNWTGDGFFGEAGIVGGEYVVAGTLVVPGPISANGARLVLDGPAAQVVTRNFQGVQSDALGSLHRNAGGGELALRGGRSLTLADASGPLLNAGVVELGAGSTLAAKGARLLPGSILRPAVTAGGAGRLASTGTVQLGGRLATPDAATVDGDVTVLTAPAVEGAFGAVSGGYLAFPGATGVTLRRPAPAPRTSPPAPAPAPPAAQAPPAAAPAVEAHRIAAATLTPRGPWALRGAALVARRRGARLTVRGVTGRGLAIVARTGPRAGALSVTWAGRGRTVSLRSRRRGLRTIQVVRAGRTRTGAVRLRTTSAGRVAVEALLVRR